MTEDEQIKQYLGLVIKIARSLNPRSQSEMDDFIQEGSIALLKALRDHDKKRGKISTLAWKYITRALIRYRASLQKNPTVQWDLENIQDCHTKTLLWETLSGNLSPTESTIINMRSEGYTFEEIGKYIGKTKSWASQIFKKAIPKIKKSNG
jgi:RNA polymerase sigma factor (sigma-70 family)